MTEHATTPHDRTIAAPSRMMGVYAAATGGLMGLAVMLGLLGLGLF